MANRWREEQAQLRNDLARHDAADRSYTEAGIALVELAGMALDLYESQSSPKQRKLLDFMVSNSEYGGGRLTVLWRKPFDLLAESITATPKNKSARRFCRRAEMVHPRGVEPLTF